jgi:hypothetical protein
MTELFSSFSEKLSVFRFIYKITAQTKKYKEPFKTIYEM